MAVTSGRIEVAVKITDEGKSDAIKKLNGDLDGTKKTTKEAERGFLGLKVGIVETAARTQMMAKAAAAVASEIMEAGKAGALLEDRMRTAFGSVAQAEKAIGALGGAIGGRALVEGIDQLRRAGVEGAISVEQIGKLAAVAQQVGVDGDTAFTRFAEAVRKGGEGLDQLGVQLNNAKVLEQYAANLGKTADQLTKTERAQASFNAAIEQVDSTMAALPSRFSSIDAAFNRLSDAGDTLQRKVLAPLASAAADVVNFLFGGGDPTYVIELSQGWDTAGAAAREYQSEIERIVRAHQDLPRVVLQAQAQVARLLGQSGRAAALSQQADFERLRGEAAKVGAEIAALDAQIRGREGAIAAQVRAAEDAQARHAVVAAQFAELERYMRTLGGPGDDVAFSRAAAEQRLLREELRAAEAVLAAEERRASAARAQIVVGQEAEEQLRRRELLQLQAVKLSEAEAAAVARVRDAREGGLRIVASTASAVADLAREQGLSGKALREAQRDQYEAERALRILEAEGQRSRLEGEIAALRIIQQQVVLRQLMSGMSAESMGELARVGQTLGALEEGAAAVERLIERIQQARFRAPGGGGGRGKPDAAKSPLQGILSAANDVPVPAMPRGGMEGEAGRGGGGVGDVLSQFFGGGNAWDEAERDLVARATRARTRILEESAKTIAALERQRTDLEAAAADRTLSLSDAERGELRSKAGGVKDQVVEAERDRQRLLTEITEQEALARGSIREAEVDAAMDSFSRITASSIAAFAALGGQTSGIEQALMGAAATAAAIASNWQNIKDGKAGTIMAIGEVATASIRNERARAAVMIGVALAEAFYQAAKGNVPGAIAGFTAAAGFASVAGRSGGGSRGARTPARAPTQAPGSGMQWGAININLFAPVVGATGQQVGAWFARELRSAEGTGMAA